MSFIFPRSCQYESERSACQEQAQLEYADVEKNEMIRFRPVVGQEYRYYGSSSLATDGGAILSGAKEPVSFYLDGRLFVESVSREDSVAFDGEPFDRQDANATGTIDYVSYARYRGNLSLDLAFGRFVVARDAVHWGPGIFTNLTFNQNAVPFDRISFTTSLGPLTVSSLYGGLAVGQAEISREKRHLYGHRYELVISQNVTFAISEQLIIMGENKPFLFTPIFPLFMAKGLMHEGSNNGNISFDAAYRQPGRGMVYTEFLLDDMESPSSLLMKSYNQNKWAWMVGLHMIADAAEVQWGTVMEYSRVQPWVYTHFAKSFAQSANLDRPLGNPQGPNSQWLTGKVFGRVEKKYYAGLQVSWLWKGNDRGSGVFDEYNAQDHLSRPYFIQGVEPNFKVSPHVHYTIGRLSMEATADLRPQFALSGRIGFYY